jgi:hypothetical protein
MIVHEAPKIMGHCIGHEQANEQWHEILIKAKGLQWWENSKFSSANLWIV